MHHASVARLLVTTLLVVHAAVAAAQPNETADAALRRGQAALKAGQIHEACEAFEASEKLAPQLDTELALASCFEQDGKPVSAARAYRKASEHDTNAERGKASIAKAVKLEVRAPKLRFAINPRPAGLVVKVDGVEVSSTDDVLVDTGPHDVVATAPGFDGHASAPVDRERAILDIVIRMEPSAEPVATNPAPTATPPPAGTEAPPPSPATEAVTAHDAQPASNDHRMRNGSIAGAGGVALLIAAAVTYEAASTRFDDVDRLCPSQACPTSAALSQGHSMLSDGHTLRDVSIATGIGGVLLVAAGSYLLLTPHTEAAHVAVNVDHTGAAVGYVGRF